MTTQDETPDVSVVVPVFNEEENLEAVVTRLRRLRDGGDRSWEFLLVNDGSRDRTADMINEAAREDGFVGIHLSRNFGHQAAVSAGIAHATGACVAVIDGDLQDPPELIPEMIATMRSAGADVCYGVRTDRKEGVIKRTCYWLFYRMLARLSPLDIPKDAGDFAVVSRRVADVLRDMPERNRFVRGLRTYAGFKQVGFPYRRAPRARGESKYTVSRLLGLALDGVVNFSDAGLRVTAFVGFGVALSSIAVGLWILVWRIFTTAPIPGFAAVAVGLFFLGGVQLISLGVLGEYVGRIHTEVKHRPPFIVSEIRRCTKVNTIA